MECRAIKMSIQIHFLISSALVGTHLVSRHCNCSWHCSAYRLVCKTTQSTNCGSISKWKIYQYLNIICKTASDPLAHKMAELTSSKTFVHTLTYYWSSQSNPNKSTMVSMSLSDNSSMSAGVYDVRGRERTELVIGVWLHFDSCYQQFAWSGSGPQLVDKQNSDGKLRFTHPEMNPNWSKFSAA